MDSVKRKVLLIGWDAADWKVIHPLMEEGKMPHLEALIDAGTMGKLATLTPVLSPMLWTSIATGKRPYKHGIHGFAEPNPNGKGVRPITNLSRSTKAVWNILGQHGLKSNVIGWWPSHPAEPINGVMVSNHYHKTKGPSPENWPMPQGAVHPPELADVLAQFRVHPSELDANQLLPFVPKGEGIDSQKDRRLEQVARILADCAGVHACATAVMQNEPWDFMAVYYDAIDHFCHGFMKYHPPRQEHIDEESFELYKGVVEGAYRFHDMMLGATLKLAGDDTTVILMSDHGFHPDHLRPKEIPKEPNGPAIEHSHLGVFVVKGPGIKKDETVFGANLLDITPTLLNLYGLPIGEDMDGRVLAEIFESPREVETIPSWDDVSGDDGRHPDHHQFHPEDEQEMMNQLVELGYVEQPDDDASTAARRSLSELQFNLARSYVDADRYADSIPVLKKLVEEWPYEYRFLNQLAYSYLSDGRLKDARRAAEELEGLQKRIGGNAKLELKKLKEQLEGLSTEDYPEDAIVKIQSEAQKIKQSNQPQNLLWGCIFTAEGKLDEALKVLKCIPEESWATPIVPLRLGGILMKLGNLDEAGELLNKARRIDSQSPIAHQLLMQLRLKEKKYQEAVQFGLAAVSRRYFFPIAHHQLGKALVLLKFYPRAEDAFQVAISQAPRMIEAHLDLAQLYERFLGKPELAKDCYRTAEELKELAKNEPNDTKEKSVGDAVYGPIEERKNIPKTWQENEVITIVSGLPRSGTSMLMQMLNAGGMCCLTDGVRTADENNPNGFFELEEVKSLCSNPNVLKRAEGKVVKVVAPVLNQLHQAQELKVRVIFIERNLDEVYASQFSMLERLGKDVSKESPDKLKNSYARLLGQVNEHLQKKKWPTLCLNYGEVVKDPKSLVGEINTFCGGGLNEEAMAEAVDISLYREKFK